ncbi:4Fe-4S binding protein [Roseiarcus fermentans]|uniref:4Fe-4S binding protein n=1 Tax=Roseiarcus fermentans TaxID=1473586 RepID=UPI001AECB740|nr:4Fe-4S binding protein [Roseiarcus fermentans]
MSDENCKHPEGAFAPVVDFSRCEAKGPCAQVCPYQVFEIRKIERSDYANLGFLSKIKNRVHGGKVSYTPNAARCRACGLCVQACPEHAIKLVKAKP